MIPSWYFSHLIVHDSVYRYYLLHQRLCTPFFFYLLLFRIWEIYKSFQCTQYDFDNRHRLKFHRCFKAHLKSDWQCPVKIRKPTFEDSLTQPNLSKWFHFQFDNGICDRTRQLYFEFYLRRLRNSNWRFFLADHDRYV